MHLAACGGAEWGTAGTHALSLRTQQQGPQLQQAAANEVSAVRRRGSMRSREPFPGAGLKRGEASSSAHRSTTKWLQLRVSSR